PSFLTRTDTSELYTLSLHDALPILGYARSRKWSTDYSRIQRQQCVQQAMLDQFDVGTLLTRFESILGAGEQMVETSIPQSQVGRSEEHTSELQSRFDLVCRLLLEKK